MRGTLLVVAVAGSLAGVSGPAAMQQPPATPSSVARLTATPLSRPSFPHASSVVGFVWSANGDPQPDARVQLRNVLTGHVEATARTSSAGEFLFDRVEGGTYVVELVNENGRVLALGAPFTVAQRETVATFVRLGAPTSWLSGTFTNVAEAVVSSAASLGVTAVVPPATAASADR